MDKPVEDSFESIMKDWDAHMDKNGGMTKIIFKQLQDQLAAQARIIENCEKVLLHSNNALVDYVERLEKLGGVFNYGRSVVDNNEKVLSLIRAHKEKYGA